MNSFITHIALSAIVATMSVGTMSAYDSMYIAGNAIDGTWNLSSCAIKMAAPAGDNAVYLWAGRLNAGEVKFLHDSADWGNSIVASDQYVTNPELGKVYPLAHMGSNDNKFKITEAGWYDVKFDAKAMTVVFSRPLFLIGECHATGSWAANKGARFTPIGRDIYKLTATFDAGNTFCLATCPAATADDWDGLGSRRYGSTEVLGVTLVTDGTQPATLQATSDEDRIFSIGASGTYTLYVDMAQLKMWAVSTPVALVGSVDGQLGWNAAQAAGMMATGADNYYVATASTMANGAFMPAERVGQWDTDVAPTAYRAEGDRTLNTLCNQDIEVIADVADNTIERPAPGYATLLSQDYKADEITTDMARYNVGQPVSFTISSLPAGARVRYRHLAQVVGDEELSSDTWTWTPPAADFAGYIVDVYTTDDFGNETIHATTGVDVSSDWKRFPRYGYVAWFDPSTTDATISSGMTFLNRCHVNAVQFQDWHWKHHRPYCPTQRYTDLSNRTISKEVVKKYIDTQHGYQMMSFFYNLAHGVLWEYDAEADGVSAEWMTYTDTNHATMDRHWGLPSSWRMLYFANPANPDWQNYIADRNDEVYENLGFDGYQIDQVGWRGNIYDYWGKSVDLPSGFNSFIKAMKQRHPDRRLIMNGVSNYGANQILSTDCLDVCYTEMWKDESSFQSLYTIKADNDRYSGGRARTVFAAYMDYLVPEGREFNTPGVLLTDACMFALGAGHLELGAGGNMLTHEYFPYTGLKVSDALKAAITDYYDFNTAYETLLFDTSRELTPIISSTTHPGISIWNNQQSPRAGHIVVHANEAADGKYVYHLLNFTAADRLQWRDLDGTMPEPDELSDINMIIDCDRRVSRAWVASPDYLGGVPVEVKYTQQGRSLQLSVPNLKYWTMLVLE